MSRRGPKSRFKSKAERDAFNKAYQAAYRKAKKDGTWKPKAGRGSESVIDTSKIKPAKKTGRPRKYATEEEAYQAKLAMQRRYAAVKRIAEGKPKRRRGRPAATDAATGVKPREQGKRGPKRKYASAAEAYQAKLAYQREYARKRRAERKAGTWTRKNRVFSESMARKIGVQTESQKVAEKIDRLPSGLFLTKEEWHRAIEERRSARAAKREARRKSILEKYGFDIYALRKKGGRPLTPEEQVGYKAWLRDEEAAYRERHREAITTYNRQYRQRKRAEALVEAQKVWTAEEWAKWRAKQERKQFGVGTPAHLVNAVVKLLAEQGGLTEDAVMEKLMGCGGIDFLVSGAEAMARRISTQKMIRAAARAVAFFIDPDGAVMFPERA